MVFIISLSMWTGCSFAEFTNEIVGEWMGPGGPHGLQLRWRASFGVRGGFDTLALPPN
jgi:hypothetical protein